MEHSFRTATTADLPAIVALLLDDTLGAAREIAAPSGDLAVDPVYASAFAAMARDPNQRFVVMEAAGVIIGCMQITFIPGLSRRGMWRGQLESVRIASHLRGQGLGRAFFQWAIAECRAKGCGLVQLSTDASRTEAQRFYLALGFEPTHVGMKLKL